MQDSSQHYYLLSFSDSGLVLNSSKAIEFGEFAELRCIENDTVTNDGFVTKLKCLPNGKFQNRKWDDKTKCRERKGYTNSKSTFISKSCSYSHELKLWEPLLGLDEKSYM